MLGMKHYQTTARHQKSGTLGFASHNGSIVICYIVHMQVMEKMEKMVAHSESHKSGAHSFVLKPPDKTQGLDPKLLLYEQRAPVPQLYEVSLGIMRKY